MCVCFCVCVLGGGSCIRQCACVSVRACECAGTRAHGSAANGPWTPRQKRRVYRRDALPWRGVVIDVCVCARVGKAQKHEESTNPSATMAFSCVCLWLARPLLCRPGPGPGGVGWRDYLAGAVGHGLCGAICALPSFILIRLFRAGFCFVSCFLQPGVVLVTLSLTNHKTCEN